MNQLAKWLMLILGYGFISSITDIIIAPWFGKSIDPSVPEITKNLIIFFGGIMAKTGYDAIQPVKMVNPPGDPANVKEAPATDATVTEDNATKDPTDASTQS